MRAADTIAAVATAPGRGAVGVVRASGPLVPRVATGVLGSLPEPRRASLRAFLDADGSVLEKGLALYFPAPHSFTGEHVLELQAHGGAQILDLLLQRLLQLGCRAARPGEFSERAFLNGKMDVAQAEAVADLIDAGSSAAARAAVRSLSGEFSARIALLQGQLTELRKLTEAAIDFPEEEIDFASNATLTQHLQRLQAGFDDIEAAARQGALLREGLNVVIAGRPNAGKSSLMNRLAGEDIAIVTPQPGTTRDLLRQAVNLDGLRLNLTDTAGLRDSNDVVEVEGVRRALKEITAADHALYVIDVSGEAADEGAPLSAQATTLVFNKIDLGGRAAGADLLANPPRIYVSAKTGAGMALLKARLKQVAGFNPDAAGTFSARRRHLDALARARRALALAQESILKRRAFELCAEELRLAQRALGEITGEFSSEDLLGEIFSSFCVGK